MADKNTIVRDARPADIDRLAAFNLAMARETEGLILDEPLLRRGVQAVFDEPARGFYIVAELDGAVRGTLMITREWSDWGNADRWWIQNVFVDPAYRGRGVYRAMHEYIVGRARAAGNVRGLRLYVERDNRQAKETYRTLGMEHAHYDMYVQEFPQG